MRQLPQSTAAGLLALLCAASALMAAETPGGPAGTVPKEVRDLAGTYTGSWTSFGINDKGEVVKQFGWTDTVKAANPRREGDQAFVTTVTELVFEGGRVPPIKVEGKDGYFLNKDGTLGDPYIETFGRVQRGARVAPTVFVYAMPADLQELTRLGFPNVLSGQHVLVKVVTHEQGAEVHRISRVTTVSWRDKDNKERWLQFVSLQGTHRR